MAKDDKPGFFKRLLGWEPARPEAPRQEEAKPVPPAALKERENTKAPGRKADETTPAKPAGGTRRRAPAKPGSGAEPSVEGEKKRNSLAEPAPSRLFEPRNAIFEGDPVIHEVIPRVPILFIGFFNLGSDLMNLFHQVIVLCFNIPIL